MAFRWSSESVVVEHKDLQANAMALDCKGRYALLAGRRNIGIVDLENPGEIIKRMSRNQQKYDVSAAEWNCVSEMENKFVLAVGEKAEIFNWSEGVLSNETTLKAHSRTITDLNWHKFDANILVTCSIDTFLHIWDSREPRKPVSSFSAIAGASQVKWNKVNSTYLASGHDCDIRIWDWRKTTQPTCYIKAHLSKINGLDWSPNHENQIVSSSNDSNVKFFDITNTRKSELQINTHNPVWKACYTPFGEGIVTVVVPPLRRGDNSLQLWSLLDCSSSIHTFVGHSDIVLDLDWRNVRIDVSQPEFQLVTWSRDNSLRIWRIDSQLLKLCGHTLDEDEVPYGEDAIEIESSDTETLLGSAQLKEDTVEDSESGYDPDVSRNQNKIMVNYSSSVSQSPSSANTENTIITRREPPKTLDIPVSSFQESLGKNTEDSLSNIYNSSSIVQNSCTNSLTDSSTSTPSVTYPSTPLSNAQTPQVSLQSEFSSVGNNFDKSQGYTVNITKNIENSICQINFAYGAHVAILEIIFPNNYPKNHPPSFRFCAGTNIDGTSKNELLRALKYAALHYFKKRKNCLDHCVKIFVTQLKALLSEDNSSGVDFNSSLPTPVNNNYFLQMYGNQQDYSIPFPRTSGARFGGSGMLVCFTRPTQHRKSYTRSSRAEPSTPRSLTALATNTASPKFNYIYSIGKSPSIEQPVSVSVYSNLERKKSKAGKADHENKKRRHATMVTIYDVTKLMPISKDLAALYVLDENDKINSCNKNRDAALLVGRKDLAQVWSVTASILSLNPTHGLEEGFPWSNHPFARKIIMSIIDHYHSRYDVQTASMLSCLLGDRAQNIQSQNRISDSTSTAGGSPYNTIHGTNTEGIDVSTMIRHNRSNSEGSLVDVSRSPAVENSGNFIAENKDKKAISFLESGKMNLYEDMRRSYAEILYRWDFLEQRTMVNKYIPSHKGVDFHIRCIECYQTKRTAQCINCKKYPFSCAICHLSVKGSSILCLVCGHGGHSIHYMDWFVEHTKCPMGCGCECITEVEQLFQ